MIFTAPNAVRFRTSREINLRGIVETTKMRKYTQLYFEKLKKRNFWA